VRAGWRAGRRGQSRGNSAAQSHVEALLQGRPPHCRLVTGFDGGAPTRELRIDVDDAKSEIARCFRDNEERLIAGPASLVGGAPPMASAWLYPLEAGGQRMGGDWRPDSA